MLERRARTITGMVLAVVAFASAYGLMFFEGQVDRPGFHFYPWLLAILCYLAGDLLALVWFKTLVIQVSRISRRLLQEELRAIAAKEPPADRVELGGPGAVRS